MATRYLTVKQTCDLLQLSEVTVRRKIAAGTVPTVKLDAADRRAVRIPENELEAWLRTVRHPGPPEAAA